MTAQAVVPATETALWTAADPRWVKLLALLGQGKESFDSANAKFQERMTQNPFYAFEWAGEIMEASAKNKVYGDYLKNVVGNQESDNPLGYDEAMKFLIESLTKHVLTSARDPRNSSSATHNLMAQMEMSVRAKLLETLSTGWF